MGDDDEMEWSGVRKDTHNLKTFTVEAQHPEGLLI